MPDDEYWQRLIATAGSERPGLITAHTFLKKWGTYSRPVLLACDDGNEYVVKGQHAGRGIVNDQVIGRLGSAIGAPVGDVALVYIPDALVAAEPAMSDIKPGISHACRWIPGCTEREHIVHTTVPENRGRFAALALVYGWVHAQDHQFIYTNDPPHLVYSVDHGHFFPNGPDWTIQSLGTAAAATPDPTLIAGCSLSNTELASAVGALGSISDAQIASAVASPPDEWGLTEPERVALASYLRSRRDQIVSMQLLSR